MPCLKYSVPVFVEYIYKMQRLAVRYDHYSRQKVNYAQGQLYHYQ